MVKGLNPAAEFPSLYAERWVRGFDKSDKISWRVWI